jgi:hypothetical protein
MVKKGGRTVNKQTGARVVVAGSTAGLLLASGVLVAPPGAAHQQDGDGDLPCCEVDDYVHGEVTKPENNTTGVIHVDAECGWADRLFDRGKELQGHKRVDGTDGITVDL